MRTHRWDGVTRRSTYRDDVVETRDRLAGAARTADWATVFKMLKAHPECVSGSRVRLVASGWN